MVTINDVAGLLSKKAYDYSTIEYPAKKEKSIDIVVVGNNKKMIVKVQENKKSLKVKSDLRNVAITGLGIPVIIDETSEEEVITDKGNVFSMNISTFKKVLDGEKIFLYKTRGGTFVKIDSKKLKEKREELGLSLGEVAQAIGVSRISIYDYERENSFVSLDIAEKLVDLFGEDILGDVLDDYDVNVTKAEEENKEVEIEKYSDSSMSKLVSNLIKKGYKVAKMNFTAIDLVASKESNKILFSEETDDVSRSFKKFNEAKKISTRINAKLVIITKDSKSKKIFEKEDFNILCKNELMEYEFS